MIKMNNQLVLAFLEKAKRLPLKITILLTAYLISLQLLFVIKDSNYNYKINNIIVLPLSNS